MQSDKSSPAKYLGSDGKYEYWLYEIGTSTDEKIKKKLREMLDNSMKKTDAKRLRSPRLRKSRIHR